MNSPRLSSAVRAARSALLPLALALFASAAGAQSRYVFVNGQRMTDPQVQALAQRACTEIPDGAYWLNLQTGAWGYAGNPQVQGTFGEACQGVGNPGGAFRLGPYATLGRANEEAAKYRAQGYRAVAFHNGDGYYVDVRR